MPNHLPERMNQFRDQYEHHLILRIENQDVEQVQQFLSDYFAQRTTGNFFHCTEEEGRKAFLHRFAVAGAAIRYRDTHRSEVEDIVALDIALRRNDREWVETLPKDMDELICITVISYAMSSIKTTSSKKVSILWRWSIKCGICWMIVVLNILRSTMLVIYMWRSLR
jgi:hypothetical protein